MNTTMLAAWARDHHYPQLVNESEQRVIVRAGQESWAEMLTERDRVCEAIARLAMFARFETMTERVEVME